MRVCVCVSLSLSVSLSVSHSLSLSLTHTHTLSPSLSPSLPTSPLSVSPSSLSSSLPTTPLSVSLPLRVFLSCILRLWEKMEELENSRMIEYCGTRGPISTLDNTQNTSKTTESCSVPISPRPPHYLNPASLLFPWAFLASSDPSHIFSCAQDCFHCFSAVWRFTGKKGAVS